MDVQKLKQLLAREEGEKLDFKAELHILTESGKKELVKDVSAMANSRGGRGYIIFGVEDKTKRIIGVDPQDFHEEQIQQLIYHRTDPPVPVSLDLVPIEGKTVAVLTVFKSPHAPHQMIQTGAFYIRRGSTTDFARRSEIASMMQENGLLSFETVVVKSASLEEMDNGKIERFFKSMGVVSGYPENILLEAFGFIARKDNGEYAPTMGGLLIFGKNPQVYLPQCYVHILHGDEAAVVTGNISEMLDKTSAIIRKIVKRSDYPIEAFEEALANALVHRDYMDMSRAVTVTITDKSIEIVNPGAIAEGSKVLLQAKEYVPVRRNPWLYQRLIALDERRRFIKSGVGLGRIRRAFEEIGRVRFINLGKQNSFKVVLPL